MLSFRRGGAVRFIPFLLLALAAAAPGCGPTTSDTTLTGTVKQGGQPVVDAQVHLYPQEGDDKAERLAGVQQDGKYQFMGPLPLGTAKLTVTPPKGSSDPNKPASAINIDPKYGNIATSGLTTPIKAGKNEYPIELTAPAQ